MECQYGVRNNVKLKAFVPGRCVYLFADVPGYRADSLLIRAKVPVRFAHRELRRDGSPYVLVFCRFKKRYEERFLACMADLERALIMEGYADYGEFCDATFDVLRAYEASE